MSLLPKTAKRAALLFNILFYCATADVSAAEKSSQAVLVKIGTILAGNQTDEFDSRLKPLEKQLKVMKYRSYRLLKEESQNVPWQGNAGFEIPGGRSLTVTPQEFRNRQISLKVRLQQGEKPIVDTTVTLPNRGHFVLGGPSHEGGVLILSVSAVTQ